MAMRRPLCLLFAPSRADWIFYEFARVNLKRVFHGLFFVLTIGWAIFWIVAHPTYLLRRGREAYGTVYRLSRQNNNCYQRAEENHQNGLKAYSFKKFWAYSFVSWRIFFQLFWCRLFLSIAYYSLYCYIVALLVSWIIRGLKTDATAL